MSDNDSLVAELANELMRMLAPLFFTSILGITRSPEALEHMAVIYKWAGKIRDIPQSPTCSQVISLTHSRIHHLVLCHFGPLHILQ